MTVKETILICEKVIHWSECTMQLKINLLTYLNDKQFYDITYKWDLESSEIHPFRHDKDFIRYSLDGDIVFRNTLSDVLVQYLQMNNEDLLKHSGSTTPEEYRKTVMKSIALLWD
jgi:hypothetical protein